MEIWVILSKLFIIVFIVLKAGFDSDSIQASFILIGLCYVCLNMVIYISQNKYIKIIFSFIALILLGISFVSNNILFIMLLPIGIFEVFFDYVGKYTLISLILATFPLFFIIDGIIPEYIFITLISYSTCALCFSSYNKIMFLSNLRDELREKNHILKNNISKDLEHENQIKYLSQLEERNKIAQEIHDKIGHIIAGSIMQLEASKLLVGKDITNAETMVQNTIDTLRTGMDSIRVTLRNIKPPSEQIGINKIKLMLDEFMVSSHIIGVLGHKGDLEKVSYRQWRIFQENISEALTNVIKYSKATKVNVSIEVLNKFIKCEVKDNGIGCNNLTKGIGLDGFEERTEGAGGKVIIDSSNGFSVIFLMPVESK